MKLFGQIVRTAVNIAVLPAVVAKDALTLGIRADGKEKTRTSEHIERIKREASEDA